MARKRTKAPVTKKSPKPVLPEEDEVILLEDGDFLDDDFEDDDPEADDDEIEFEDDENDDQDDEFEDDDDDYDDDDLEDDDDEDAPEEIEKRTVIVTPQGDPESIVSTYDPKWIRQMAKLEAEGHAEEINPEYPGCRSFSFPTKLLRLPFYRKPRTWTKQQKDEARARLAKARAERAAASETGSKKAKKGKPAPKGKAKGTKKVPATKKTARKRK